ncbi:MAG: alpha/beta hydrolase [Desulfobacteraceae bacterium]|nr:alpha/beta hydrolase [Desulfobacteraceae bacterium]
MKSKIRETMIYFILIYVFIGAVLFFSQRKFIYFPSEKIPHSYDMESISNENETIEVIVLNKGKKDALLYFGGNAEPVIYNAEDFLREFPMHTVYLFNYRGYGGSTGNPTEKGIYSDALVFFDKVEKKHSKISVVGRSLGSGVATKLASEKPIEKLILITPFDSIKSVAQNQFLIYPMFLLLKDKYDSISRVKHIKAKTIAIVAEHDEVIPNKHSFRLINEFPKDQIIVKIIANSGHNDISDKLEYYDHLKVFIKD